MIRPYDYYRGRADFDLGIPKHLKQHNYCVGLGSNYNKGYISLFFLIPEKPDIIIATSLPTIFNHSYKIYPGKLFLQRTEDPVAIPTDLVKFIEDKENINHGLLHVWEEILFKYTSLTRKDIIRWEKSIYYPTFQPWKNYEVVQVNTC